MSLPCNMHFYYNTLYHSLPSDHRSIIVCLLTTDTLICPSGDPVCLSKTDLKQFGVLEFVGIFIIVWLGHVGDRLEFAVIVESIFLRMGSARIFRACCSCLGTWLEFDVPVYIFFL